MKTILLIIAFIILLAGIVIYNETKTDTLATVDTPSSAESTTEEGTTEAQAAPQGEGNTGVPEVKTSGLEINLSNKGLARVSMDVFDRTSATKLDLSNNNLTGALQAEVRHLQNLEVLDLSHNNFTGVPAEVGQLAKLRVLDLSNNPITGLPYEIGNLSNLELLDLRGTQYSEQDLTVILQSLPENVEVRQ